MTHEPVAAPSASPDAISPRLRISKILEQRKVQEGSYVKLEDAIRLALPDPNGTESGGPRPVDRRKLKSIVLNDPKLVLSVGELWALDHYLEQFGHGLAYNPFFEKPDVVRSLADSGRIAFLVGSKPDLTDPFRVNISHWDVLGLNHIQSGVLGCSQAVRIDIREIRMPANVGAARKEVEDAGRNDPQDRRNDPRDLFCSTGPSLGVFGSSRGTHMAEWMLCRMADLPLFKKLRGKLRFDLPFHFVWSKDHSHVLPSAFHLDEKAVREENADVADAVLHGRAACLRHKGGYLVDELMLGRDEGDTFALCAAQRRRDGQIWLLVAGLTGPATAAGARWVDKMATTVYDASRGQSPVFWNIVRAHAVRDRDTFDVGEVEVVTGGEAWA